MFSPTLHILNPGWPPVKPREPDVQAVQRLLPLARANGGQYPSDLGAMDVFVNAYPGYAYFAFRVNDEPAALAALAWEPSVQTAVWKNLLESHENLMRNPKPAAVMPEMVPWLAISIHHTWDRAADEARRQLLFLHLWAMALAIYTQQQLRSSARN